MLNVSPVYELKLQISLTELVLFGVFFVDAVTNLEYSIEGHSRKWTVFTISSVVGALFLSC